MIDKEYKTCPSLSCDHQDVIDMISIQFHLEHEVVTHSSSSSIFIYCSISNQYTYQTPIQKPTHGHFGNL
jgi:hypothetical protein